MGKQINGQIKGLNKDMLRGMNIGLSGKVDKPKKIKATLYGVAFVIILSFYIRDGSRWGRLPIRGLFYHAVHRESISVILKSHG